MLRHCLNIVGLIVSALLGAGVAQLCVDPVGRGWFSEYELFCHFLLPPIAGAVGGALAWKQMLRLGEKRGWRFTIAEIGGLMILVGGALAVARSCTVMHVF